MNCYKNVKFSSVYQREGIIITKKKKFNKFPKDQRTKIKHSLHISLLYKISQLRPF